MRRATRFARAIALVGSASSCTLPEGGVAQPTGQDAASVEAAVEASVEAAADDAPADVLTGDGRGHCITADDGTVSCDPGMVCVYDSAAHCAPRAADANLQECGLVGCDVDSLCFCANARTSVCLCNYDGGPLAPPDLPR